jgi:hypothetical protein
MVCTSGISLVCLVHLVSLIQLNKPDRLNRPNEQDKLADFFSILLEKHEGREKLSPLPPSMPVKPFATYSAVGYSAGRASRS